MRHAAGSVFSTAKKRAVPTDSDRDRLASEVSSMKIDRDDLGLAWEARGGDTLLSYEYVRSVRIHAHKSRTDSQPAQSESLGANCQAVCQLASDQGKFRAP